MSKCTALVTALARGKNVCERQQVSYKTTHLLGCCRSKVCCKEDSFFIAARNFLFKMLPKCLCTSFFSNVWLSSSFSLSLCYLPLAARAVRRLSRQGVVNEKKDECATAMLRPFFVRRALVVVGVALHGRQSNFHNTKHKPFHLT